MLLSSIKGDLKEHSKTLVLIIGDLTKTICHNFCTKCMTNLSMRKGNWL